MTGVGNLGKKGIVKFKSGSRIKARTGGGGGGLKVNKNGLRQAK